MSNPFEQHLDKEKLLFEAREALIVASQMPYNNAAIAYHLAGKQPDLRMGGSCIDKLSAYLDNLPKGLQNSTKIIGSQIGKTTHYAAITSIKGNRYYFDPFLWQTEPISLSDPNMNQSNTLFSTWVVRRNTISDDGLPEISFITFDASNLEAEPVETVKHNFTKKVGQLPPPTVLNSRPNLPSFMMHVPYPDNQEFFKVWYDKKNCRLNDIWVQDANGRRKVSPTGDAHARANTIERLQMAVGLSEKDICEYFSLAHELEKSNLNPRDTLDDDTNHPNI